MLDGKQYYGRKNETTFNFFCYFRNAFQSFKSAGFSHSFKIICLSSTFFQVSKANSKTISASFKAHCALNSQ